MDILGELPPGEPPKGGIESPSISDDEQYQKLDGDLWQQGQGEGQLGAGSRPAGTLVAPSAEPEVQQAETDDRRVRILCLVHRASSHNAHCNRQLPHYTLMLSLAALRVWMLTLSWVLQATFLSYSDCCIIVFVM